MTSAPKRAMSNRLDPAAIYSMAQQASPIGMGQREFLRNQFNTASTLVTITSPSILVLYPTSVCAEVMSWTGRSP